MVRLEVIEEFTLKDFAKLKNIVRKGKDTKEHLYVGDTFECDEKMQDYLTGNNSLKRVVARVIEVVPEEASKKPKKKKK